MIALMIGMTGTVIGLRREHIISEGQHILVNVRGRDMLVDRMPQSQSASAQVFALERVHTQYWPECT
jgi:hypothetical protein